MNNTGKVIQVVGVVVDVEFADKKLPAINDALETKIGNKRVVLEVAQHLSETNWWQADSARTHCHLPAAANLCKEVQ